MQRFFRQILSRFFARNRKRSFRRDDLRMEPLESRQLLATYVLPDAPNVEFEITNDWNSGHQASMPLNNDETTSYSNWNLEFDYEGTINNLWNAEVENLDGGRYRITPPSWNPTLDAGERLVIGFVAAGPASQPTNFSFSADGTTSPPDGGGGDNGGGDNGGGGGETDPPVTSAPNQPIINGLIDYQAGGITVAVNLYAGTPAESWKLYQNGVVIHEATFSQTSATPQSDSVFLPDNTYGVFHYQVEVTNAAGSTLSNEVSLVVGGASPITIDGADIDGQALQITIDQGTFEYDLSLTNDEATSFTVVTNNSNVADAEIVGDGTLRVRGLTAGRASLKLTDQVSGEVRYVGIRVRTESGELPGLPDYVSIGSVSEDTPGDLAFWRDYDAGDPLTNKFVDSRYIYLPGGPFNGWRNWGDRIGSYVRESLKLGMIPQFVYYNIPDSAESFEIATRNINSVSYMEAYFQDLQFALETIHAEAGDELVQMILEPDFLGYIMQNAGASTDQLSAVTSAIYSSGVLTQGVDPQFDNTIAGLVRSINYTVGKYAPNVEFGWQFNLWASPGIENPVPANGIVHLTDTMGIEAGRAAIAREAELIAEYYMEAGVLSYGADFISLDKYGLDAAAESGAAANPAGSTWFWNSDHWHNYLLFVETLTTTTQREMVLWQIPVGHINNTLADNPYDAEGNFDPLSNTPQRYEDSAATFFLGDSFTVDGARLDYFSRNEFGDPELTVSGNTVTWGSHIDEARAVGVRQILFGAGVPASTDSIGSEPTDDYWWITKVQQYYQNPTPVDVDPGDPVVKPTISLSGATVNEGDTGFTLATFTITLSKAASEPVTVQYQTAAGTAQSGIDFQPISGTVTFAPGETSQTVNVNVLGDMVVEANESFELLLSNPIGGLLTANTKALGTIINDDTAPPVTPAISISDAEVVEADVSHQISPGFLSTRGNQIVDANGTPVKITAVSWFGFESDINVPHGIWTRNYQEMMDQMVEAGFNAIRLPINNEMFDQGVVTDGINTFANPDLVGLTPVEILDRIVEYAGEIDLRIVLDHHRSDNGVGALNDGLWYTSQYPEERFISDWQMLAQRYQGNPTVIGADLHNEPHGLARWGNGDLATDWRLAAERAGNAILEVNPDWLIFVEGVEVYDGDFYWWGGNLQGVREHPVRLSVPNKLVYSPHAYPNSIFSQPWFSDPAFPDNLPDVWRENWGFIYEEDIAPIWLGEFGSRLQDPKDIAWMNAMAAYLAGDLDGDGTSDLAGGDEAISWSFWSWNPNSTDTGGILQDDWRTLDQQKLDLLAPVQFPLLADDEGSAQTDPIAGISIAEFVVTLSEATTVPVSVDFATSALTATSGVDFKPINGTLEFQPGETSRTIQVEVIGDLLVEGNETMSIILSNPSLATIDDGTAIGTIIDNDEQAPEPEPVISVSGATVVEGDAGDLSIAQFHVNLDSPSDQPVTVNYQTIDGTATAGQDYEFASGTITFAPGETSKTIQVHVLGDTAVESDESFQLQLSNPIGGVLADSSNSAQAVIQNDDAAPPSGNASLQLDIANAWNTGFQAKVALQNTGNEPWEGWTLQFTFAGDITSIWNAEIVSRVGDVYTIRNPSWNTTIAPNSSAAFGFIGKPSSGDGYNPLFADFQVNGESVSLQ